MFETKKKILCNSVTITFLILMMLLFSTLLVLAKSSSVHFTMKWDGYYINGSHNGVYHSLDAGGVQIKGTIDNSYSRPGAIGPNPIYIELRNKTSGNKFGTIRVNPKANGIASFSRTFSSVGGGTKYYLIIYRSNADGRTMIGDATLKNIYR